MSDPYAQLPSRSGAHRPRRSPWRDVVPTVAVLLAVVLIGIGAWVLTRSTASTITSSGTDDTGSTSQDTPVPTAPTTGATTATGSATTSAPSSPTSATSTAGAVDHSAPVTVLNATRTSGLAASVASTLRSLGWTVPTTDNYRRGQPPTTVFYGSAEQRATAKAVADDVGGDPDVQESSEFGSQRITVVIGSDYNG